MGIGLYAVTHIFMLIWTYTYVPAPGPESDAQALTQTWDSGEVNSKRIRERYLRAVLRQEIAYFDKLGAGEVTTRIETDTHLIQQGISEKVPCTFIIPAQPPIERSATHAQPIPLR